MIQCRVKFLLSTKSIIRIILNFYLSYLTTILNPYPCSQPLKEYYRTKYNINVLLRISKRGIILNIN